MIGRVKVGRDVLLRKAKGIEICGQMPAHAIGAHQHHRADRIARRSNSIALRHRLARRLRRRLDLDRHLRGVERAGQIVGFASAPVGALPAGAALRFEFVVLVTHVPSSFPLSCRERVAQTCELVR